MPSIADQHVVVLGGTSGFGFATAKAALAEGARVTIASRSAEKLSGALARLGNHASGECVDVTDKPMLERFFAGLGPFDHLAVTVGDPLLSKQIMELTDEEARSAFEVRFWGQFNTVRAAYPHISKSGSITLVSGLAGQRASPGRGIYAGVLGGIEGMVKSFAAELRPGQGQRGVRRHGRHRALASIAGSREVRDIFAHRRPSIRRPGRQA
jgi:NAD(P)-dependent dehydrogenase (short-subunit alcohol dehydrogenase family)